MSVHHFRHGGTNWIACRLDDWAGVRFGSPYTPPEMHRECLEGVAADHPLDRFPDGKAITTGTPRYVCGRFVLTGRTLYYLGRRSRKYSAWLAKNGVTSSKSAPFVVVDGVLGRDQFAEKLRASNNYQRVTP